LCRPSGAWGTVLAACRIVEKHRHLSHSTRAREAHCGFNPVHGFFLRLDNFLLQNCAIQRKAAWIDFLWDTSEKQTAQHCENLRKNRL